MILYTDMDPFCCSWLEELIKAGCLPKGDVLCADMTEINPESVRKYAQRHWCCGIGGWPYALKLAGWPEDRPIDTASLPCQPFSVAGKQKGFADERHLWPSFRQTVSILRPATLVGEQVPQAVQLGWLDGVFDDLEELGYACGAVVLPACSLGAPHIRQRLFWLAQSEPNRCQGRKRTGVPVIAEGQPEPAGGSVVNGSDRLADAPNDNRRGGIGGAQARAGQDGIGRRGSASGSSNGECGGDGSTGGETLNPGVEAASRRFNSCGPLSQQTVGGLANPQRDGLGPRRAEREGFVGESALDDASSTCGLADAEHPERRQGNTARNQHDGNDAGWQETPSGLAACRPVDWRDSVFIPCADGKWRRVPGRVVQPDRTGPQPGSEAAERTGHRHSVDPASGRVGEWEIEPALFPLADGIPNRVGMLRGAGNAIVPQVAAEFIRAFMEENH